ncbi:serine proteinase inhibitor [Ancylostoma ceylanicum]|uniref:Serine proteinase inhibitor n=1 Tax=Ancylostoma ceylanicum TaxID=53326 RepID=A0A0D6LFU4_9BILA|nr:serine proteinase inhibitor [Ancylostoma ceylanicum]
MFALAMVQIGSKGKTKMQINEVISKGKVKLSLVITWQKVIIVKANQTINNFVSGATGGKIKNFIRASSLRAASSLLVNAIYFMAEWQHKFSKKLSYKAKFFYAEGKTRQVDFMNDVQVRRAYAENDDMQITIPKMKLETDSNLKAALIAVGVTELFSTSADLSGVSDASIAVSAATHKAVIEMDEESTSAAAATAFRFSYKSFSKNLRRFIANHPFLFIVTKSGHPLFMGKFANE